VAAAGTVVTLSLARYLALQSPVARRLYRLLEIARANGIVSWRVSLERLRDMRPDDEETVMAAVAAGARGYLYKNASRAEVRTTVSQILVESPVTAVPPDTHSVPDGGRPMLTERELDVLAGMCEGRSNAEIGRSLFLSEDTVKTHARRLFKKLGAVDRAHAVALGYRWGLVR